MRALISAVALFCDSVRQEKTGTDTIVGVMPDNMSLPEAGGLIPRLSIYVRLHLDPAVDPNPIQVLLKTPDGEERELLSFENDLADRARRESAGKPFAGIVGRLELTPFPVLAFGRATVTVKTPFETVIAGTLNFTQAPATTSSTEPPQPAQHSAGTAAQAETRSATSRPSRRRVSQGPRRKRPSPS